MKELQQKLQGYSSFSSSPPELRVAVLEVEKALQDQNAILSVQEEEKKRIHQRFDRELQRLYVLWHSQAYKK